GLLAIALFVQMRIRAAAAHAAERQVAELRGQWDAIQTRLSTAEQESAAAKARADYLSPLEPQLREAERKIRDLQAEIAARDSRAEAERLASEQRIADLTRLRGE